MIPRVIFPLGFPESSLGKPERRGHRGRAAEDGEAGSGHFRGPDRGPRPYAGRAERGVAAFPSGGTRAWARARRPPLLPPPLARSFPPHNPHPRRGRGRGPAQGAPSSRSASPADPGLFPPLAWGGENAPSGTPTAGVSGPSTAAGEGSQKGPEPPASRTRFPPHSVAAQTAEDEGFILFGETLL